MKQIGFVGLGVMGLPMASNLASKFPGVKVFDADPGRMKLAPAGKTVPASGLREIGETCGLVFLSLPSTAVVKEAAAGKDGLAERLSPGSVVVDTSTTETSGVLDLAARLAENKVDFLDAPVSGGEKAAVEGTLSFMVGGKEEVFASCREYLSAMGASVVRVGGSSSGQVAKCVNQMIVGAAFAVIAEAFALGAKAGLDPKVLYEAIKGGWAGSKLLDVAAKDMFSREFKPGGTVNIHWKDLGYALSLAKDADAPTPVTALVHEIFKAARAAGDGKLSQPAVVRLWERLLGLEVK